MARVNSKMDILFAGAAIIKTLARSVASEIGGYFYAARPYLRPVVSFARQGARPRGRRAPRAGDDMQCPRQGAFPTCLVLSIRVDDSRSDIPECLSDRGSVCHRHSVSHGANDRAE